jgi:hypothetical protein
LIGSQRDDFELMGVLLDNIKRTYANAACRA